MTKRSAKKSVKRTSSVKAVKSKASPGVLALGAEIVKQLGELADRNLLVRWMSEYLGELMAQYVNATGRQKAELGQQCASIILDIWSYRHHLPSGARPLEQFEPLFNVIEQLKAGESRYPSIRIFGRSQEATGPGSKLFNAALAIDKAASSLIRYSVAETAAQLAKHDKRWVEIAKKLSPRDWDMEIIFTTYGEAETLVEKNEKLKKRDIEDIEAMIGHLELLEARGPALRTHLEQRLKAAKNRKTS